MQNQVIFTEKLNLFRWKFFLIWIGFGFLFISNVYYQITSTENQQNSSKIFILGVVVAFAILFWSFTSLFGYFIARLKTNISKNQIKIKYLRIIEITIDWKNVESAEIVTLKLVGNKLATGWENYGAGKNSKGSNAMALVLKNGKKLLIGTEKGPELNKIIEKMPVANIGYNSLWFYSTPKNKLYKKVISGRNNPMDDFTTKS